MKVLVILVIIILLLIFLAIVPIFGENIINLKQKDNIIFTDVDGYTYIYEVLEIEILNPKEVSKMINNDFDLTLYTCTSDGLNRITIRCNRVINTI